MLLMFLKRCLAPHVNAARTRDASSGGGHRCGVERARGRRKAAACGGVGGALCGGSSSGNNSDVVEQSVR